VVDIFRNEVKKNNKLLNKDIEITRRNREETNKTDKISYMNFGSKVFNFLS
jgi:hypothetical protein